MYSLNVLTSCLETHYKPQYNTRAFNSCEYFLIFSYVCYYIKLTHSLPFMPNDVFASQTFSGLFGWERLVRHLNPQQSKDQGSHSRQVTTFYAFIVFILYSYGYSFATFIMLFSLLFFRIKSFILL